MNRYYRNPYNPDYRGDAARGPGYTAVARTGDDDITVTTNKSPGFTTAEAKLTIGDITITFPERHIANHDAFKTIINTAVTLNCALKGMK